MKLIEFKEFNGTVEERKINKKKIAITIVISVIMALIITFLLLYIYNEKFRDWSDMHILMKTVSEGTLSSIDIDSSDSVGLYAYDKYVAVAKSDKLQIYNSSAKEVASIDININSPIFNANGKYLVVGDKGKQKVTLISGTKILWSQDVEGNISRVSVNESGYVSTVCTGSTYKSIVAVYKSTGEQLFKTFIPDNVVVDSTISSDNRLLSFAEIDTTKTTINTVVKTISIKDAMANSENSVINSYKLPNNSVVIDLRYQGSKNIVCMCDDGISILADGNIDKNINFQEEGKKYSFAGINLVNTMYVIEETSDGLSNQNSKVLLTNSGNKKQKEYTISGIAKKTSASDDNIAVNLGSEAYFINTRGWLIKKYVASQEIRDVIVSDRIAAIVFRDKIEILIL